jgi:hypothetical protein
MTELINHVLLTRFNLPSAGVESRIRSRDGWLVGRVELFERYCLPSVRAQTNQNFSWIVYFDPESPLWLMERIATDPAWKICRPIFRSTVNRAELLSDIRAGLDKNRPILITTNLDNDDGLATDFVDRLQRIQTPLPRAAVYFANGLIARGNETYLRRDRLNAFCSVRETLADPVTCWSDWHNLLGRSMPVMQLGDAPAWFQLVHGANVSNRVRGRLVSPDDYRDTFGTLLDGFEAPSARRVFRDRFIGGPARACREGARGAAKWLVMRIGGKAGLDRIKAMRRSRTVRGVE